VVNGDQQHHVVGKALLYIVGAKPPLLELLKMFLVTIGEPFHVICKL